MKNSTILLTGAAGFIGSCVTDRLLKEAYRVVGIDNFNDYYDSKIKEENIKDALKHNAFKLYREDILNFEKLNTIFKLERPQKVVHLAARAGVRPSIVNPKLYAEVNVLGTVYLLKLAVDYKVKQFIFGSSSSVYGNSPRLPFSENDPCDAIISPYGASKRSAEFWVESFNKTYGLKSVVLRLFTVYGPHGRPDMAPAIFAKSIVDNRPIRQFGDGSSSRDYTYIDDVVGGVIKTLTTDFNFEIINLGNNHPVSLKEFILTLESIIGIKAKIRQLAKQAGDVEKTWANIKKAQRLLNWTPQIDLKDGLEITVKDFSIFNYT